MNCVRVKYTFRDGTAPEVIPMPALLSIKGSDGKRRSALSPEGKTLSRRIKMRLGLPY